ncbi:chromosomal replication initiator protein, partial CDS, partial [Candidatus Phytoplasma solani]
IKKHLEIEFVSKEKNEKIDFKNINNENIKIEEKKINFNKYNSGNINSKYHLDNFVVGKSNKFAFKIAKKIIEEEKVTINPFYIFGKTGIGKTHLIQGIGNYIIEKKNKKV